MAADLRMPAGVVSVLAVALVSAFIVSLEKPWTRITVRVGGSWVSASGLLMLEWLLKGQE